ncbi:hypothetical protein [Thermogemmata fonticola]|jgi:hypothetical protein|uniref:Uncharacterized protein n=1 Tax=Thermogemmata fonticola TaxID=2755323 RepID=A0A7V8VES6_9BACT|nr:hypothetical protein [Thermogemmata fonticola]MBA2226631.1 hypothetical protein [Thermogemmata fonticola]
MAVKPASKLTTATLPIVQRERLRPAAAFPAAEPLELAELVGRRRQSRFQEKLPARVLLLLVGLLGAGFEGVTMRCLLAGVGCLLPAGPGVGRGAALTAEPGS